MTPDELTTPVLVLDLDAARRNIAAMVERLRPLHAALRPHVKVHKCSQLARLQVDAGAIGVTCATVWEAYAMARASIDDILIANQVVGSEQMRAVAALARTAGVTVAVDDAGNLRRLAAAAVDAGSELGVLVEIDVGMHRCGLPSASAARELAALACNTRGVRFRGLMGYEGHCMLEPNRDKRATEAAAAIGRLVDVADALESAQIACEVVSAGGTGTCDQAGGSSRVTEIQAGSYVVMDVFHAGLVDGFQPALTVVATVISRTGERVVLDVGRKGIGADNAPPRLVGADSDFLFVHEEHTGFAVRPPARLEVGDRVVLQPGYAATTVNLYDAYHVTEGGRVTDRWPVEARSAVPFAGRGQARSVLGSPSAHRPAPTAGRCGC